MGELIGGAAFFVGLVLCAWFLVMKMLPPPKPAPKDRGTWRQAVETNGDIINVVVIREYGGYVNARLLVAAIDGTTPDWSSKLQDAVAEASIRKATLEVTEQQ